MKTGSPSDVLAALRQQGHEVIKAKGGGFFVKGRGRVSLSAARRMTGITPTQQRSQTRQMPWGEFAWVAGLNGKLSG